MDSPSSGTRYGVPAHRKVIVDQLTQAYGSDMLEQRDFERRLERAEAADTIEELDAIVADFGPPTGATKLPVPGERHFTLLGNQNHVMTPATGDGLRATVGMGNLKIDLTAFAGTGRLVQLQLLGGMGEVTVRVPAGTRVVRRVRLLLGDFRSVQAREPGVMVKLFNTLFRGKPVAPPVASKGGPPPTVVVDGWWALGNITLREELP